MKFNGFIVALLLSILISWFFPQGPEVLPLKAITDIGIGFIFFFYGLKLSPAEFKAGFYNFRIHILIQVTTFIVFPLLVLAFSPFFEGGTRSNLWLALFFLGALPSTVSSSIVMVSLARGNLPAAIFNASLSGLIGIIVTPLWMSLFMVSSSEFEFGEVVQKLVIQIILPLVIGLFLQQYFGNFANRNSKKISLFDKSVIILIVYSSFSSAFSTQLFTTVGLGDLLKLLGMVSVLFFLVYFGLGMVSKWQNLSVADEITAKFCGTKKSLVHGSVMVKVIFGNSAANALYLLPVMLFHILQLVVVAVFAENYRKRGEKINLEKN